jgi:hypothetical protein
MELPFELISKILLYRPRHPTAKLIHDVHNDVKSRLRANPAVLKMYMESKRWNFHHIVLQDLRQYYICMRLTKPLLLDRTFVVMVNEKA